MAQTQEQRAAREAQLDEVSDLVLHAIKEFLLGRAYFSESNGKVRFNMSDLPKEKGNDEVRPGT